MIKKWGRRQKGFTIVELLIVVVVVAILAALTIVSYNGIQNRAQVTEVKADLGNLDKAVSLLKVDDRSLVSSATWQDAFRNTQLYEATAIGGPKTFMVCATATDWAVGAWWPKDFSALDRTHYVSSVNGLAELDLAGLNSLTVFCDTVLPGSIYRTWAHNPGIH